MYDICILFGFNKSNIRIGGVYIGYKDAKAALELIRKEDDLQKIHYFCGNSLFKINVVNRTPDQLCVLPKGHHVFNITLNSELNNPDIILTEIKNPPIELIIASNLELFEIRGNIPDYNKRITTITNGLIDYQSIYTSRKLRNCIVNNNLWKPTNCMNVAEELNITEKRSLIDNFTNLSL